MVNLGDCGARVLRNAEREGSSGTKYRSRQDRSSKNFASVLAQMLKGVQPISDKRSISFLFSNADSLVARFSESFALTFPVQDG